MISTGQVPFLWEAPLKSEKHIITMIMIIITIVTIITIPLPLMTIIIVIIIFIILLIMILLLIMIMIILITIKLCWKMPLEIHDDLRGVVFWCAICCPYC